MCRFFEARSYNDLMQLAPQKRAHVLPFIAEWCSWRAAQFTGREVMQAYTLVMAMREAAVAATLPFDFVVSPASPILPYEAELPAPKRSAQRSAAHRLHRSAFNMSEQPAASINWTYTGEALPISSGDRQALDDLGVPRLCWLSRDCGRSSAPGRVSYFVERFARRGSVQVRTPPAGSAPGVLRLLALLGRNVAFRLQEGSLRARRQHAPRG